MLRRHSSRLLEQFTRKSKMVSLMYLMSLMGSKLAMRYQMLQVVELAHPLKVVAAAAKGSSSIQLVMYPA
jgi:hypothetical protein